MTSKYLSPSLAQYRKLTGPISKTTLRLQSISQCSPNTSADRHPPRRSVIAGWRLFCGIVPSSRSSQAAERERSYASAGSFLAQGICARDQLPDVPGRCGSSLARRTSAVDGWNSGRQDGALCGLGDVFVGPPPTLANSPPPRNLEKMLRVARKFDVAGRDAPNAHLHVLEKGS